MTRTMTTARAACAALAALAGLMIGANGAANAADVPQTSGSTERVIWSSADGSARASVGRDQPCDTDRLCLYEHRDFNQDQDGRMLQFNDDSWEQLSALGFNDMTSSWKNNLGRDACLSKHWPASSDWISLRSDSSASRMGSWGDEASGVKAGSCSLL